MLSISDDSVKCKHPSFVLSNNVVGALGGRECDCDVFLFSPGNDNKTHSVKIKRKYEIKRGKDSFTGAIVIPSIFAIHFVNLASVVVFKHPLF